MILRLGGWLLFAAALALTSPARAQPRFAMESTTGPQPSTFLPGLTEILVRIDNPGPDKLVGEVELSNDAGRSRGSVSAPFAVDAGSKALVRLPIMADQTLTGRVRVQGNVVHTESFSPHLENSVRVLDAHQPSRLRPALESLHLAVPGGPGGYSPGNFPRLRVAVAPRDDATGAAIFPVRPASWHDIHLVVAPSDALLAASAEELAALSGYVLGGGTLAIHLSRPEDLRAPLLVTLLGGAPRLAPAAPELTEPIVHPGAAPGGPRDGWLPPATDHPNERFELRSFVGGNLRSTPTGSAASYGLGEVVLLAFDPSDPEVLADPFLRVRAVELARRAFVRSTLSVLASGRRPQNFGFGRRGDEQGVAAFLDPSRTARWGIGAAVVLVCIYAVLAGPVSFGRARKENRPLIALLRLPLLSLATFLGIVLLGYLMKGVGQTATRLTVVEASGGVSQGNMRRYRGFFSPSARDLSVGPSVPQGSVTALRDDRGVERLRVDSRGYRLVDIEGMPSQTVVIREDGVLDLGAGVALVPSSTQEEVVVINRTGALLQHLVIKTPDNRFRYAAALAPNDRVDTTSLGRGQPRLASWGGPQLAAILGSAPADPQIYSLSAGLAAEGASELGDAWVAASVLSPHDAAWFPSRAPVLLAAWEDRRASHDSSIPLVKDLTLVRVVGFGGEP